MNPGEYQKSEAKRQELLGQLKSAETALRGGLGIEGFGSTTRSHMERAVAHVSEAYIAINEGKSVRSVQQLVEDLNRIQLVVENARRDKSQRI
jgi:hypothetical protein